MVENKLTNKTNKRLKKSIIRYEKLHKKVLEEITFDLKCKIYSIIDSDYVDEHGISRDFGEVLLGEYECGLDYVKYGRITLAIQKEDFTSTKFATLFISNKIEVPLNSRIVITINGKEIEFTKTGIPDRYNTHQEIPLERSEKG